MFKLAKTIIVDNKNSNQHVIDAIVGLGLGGVAGAVSTSVVQPLDQIQNMMATYKVNPGYKGRTSSYLNLVKAIYHGDMGPKVKDVSEYTRGLRGLKNFYDGVGVKLIKTAPQSAILLGLNTLLYKLYKNYTHNGKD